MREDKVFVGVIILNVGDETWIKPCVDLQTGQDINPHKPVKCEIWKTKEAHNALNVMVIDTDLQPDHEDAFVIIATTRHCTYYTKRVDLFNGPWSHPPWKHATVFKRKRESKLGEQYNEWSPVLNEGATTQRARIYFKMQEDHPERKAAATWFQYHSQIPNEYQGKRVLEYKEGIIINGEVVLQNGTAT